MVLDWCGPHHATGLGSLYWFLSVGPDTSYHLAGIENEKSANPVLLEKMPQPVCRHVGHNRIRVLKVNGGPGFPTEQSNTILRAWNLDYDQSCPDHHYQVGEVEHWHSFHQNAMRTLCSPAHSPSLLWEELFPHGVELHNANIHKQGENSPLEFMIRLAAGTRFHFVWGCLGDVHNHTSSRGPYKFQDSGIPCIYVGTGSFDCTHVAIRYFDNVCVANFFILETGKPLV